MVGDDLKLHYAGVRDEGICSVALLGVGAVCSLYDSFDFVYPYLLGQSTYAVKEAAEKLGSDGRESSES